MRTRWLPVLALAVLAPVCAEYLWGYDDSTGHPGTLVGNLIVFVPLYGCPALLIREVARRRGLGWPGIVLLAAAFGVIEAGLVDQSMFSRDYRDIPYWHDIADPTYVAPIGLSIFLAVTFVSNHVIASIAGPIALVEALAGKRGLDPWLGRPMIVVTTLLYLGASALVLGDHLVNESDHASAGQLVGAGVVAVLLIVGALLMGRRTPTQRAGAAPSPWLVAAGRLRRRPRGRCCCRRRHWAPTRCSWCTPQRPPRSGGCPVVRAGGRPTPLRSPRAAERVRCHRLPDRPDRARHRCGEAGPQRRRCSSSSSSWASWRYAGAAPTRRALAWPREPGQPNGHQRRHRARRSPAGSRARPGPATAATPPGRSPRWHRLTGPRPRSG